ncbi:uncharacterized protein LOC117344620 [Pecten maximus]|uniref:uncharacterized protein LOC117344620 n=1 Tax=Pecten maximus TaxID=6579 RepID=UPI001458559E|nr:uncharacterized protein LOC117344620 [Pecten maximus]XP_033763341.1 uncharacterized protein LOC117344620 [Pecten maximus]XP_033763348.1 uncharacterized protein LOC117344620 [Pecten maximus]
MIPHVVRLIIFVCVTMDRTTGNQSHEGFSSPCEILDCANNGVCMEVISGNGSDSMASCKCSERYTGSRCQYVVVLKYHLITSNSAKLEISRKHSNDSRHTFDNTLDNESRFTIIYWTNFSSAACTMASGITSGPVTIDSLEPDTRYTFCAFSGMTEFCHHYNVDDGMPINCVLITTSAPKQDDDSPVYIAPLVLSILFVIGLCILLAVIIKRKYIECLYKYNPCLSSNTKSDTTVLYMGVGGRRKGNNTKHLMPLPERPPPDIVLHPPSSPGRPPHKLAHSTRGYTSTFSARNESAIPLTTVIEYGPTNDTSTPCTGYNDHNSAETSLILHQIDTES